MTSGAARLIFAQPASGFEPEGLGMSGGLLSTIASDFSVNGKNGISVVMFLTFHRILNRIYKLQQRHGAMKYLLLPLRFVVRILRDFPMNLQAGYISPVAELGPSIEFRHGLAGIFVSQNATIGRNVVIFQNVVVGSLAGVGARARKLAGNDAPVIEDDVVLCAHAVVIGPIRVGKGAIVGANATVLSDVAERQVIAAGMRWAGPAAETSRDPGQ